MQQHVLLNSVEHHGVRVDARPGTGRGDEVMAALTFGDELRAVQAHYPIVFGTGPGGGLQPLALLGLQPGQNLFLGADSWDAYYIPLSIRRQPFLIGSSTTQDGAMVHIDLAHPRVRIDDADGEGAGVGELLFREFGGPTPFLQERVAMLDTLRRGVQRNGALMAHLQQHALLVPFGLDLRLPGHAPRTLDGFWTVDEARLRALDAAALGMLHADGALEACYMVLASQVHLGDLVRRLEQRLQAGAHA